MAPALTKILKDGHGIHLSSRPTFVSKDPDEGAMHSSGLESQMNPAEECDLQKMWLNFTSFPPQDSCLSVSPLDIPTNPALSPCLRTSASQHQTVLLPSHSSLLSILSFSEGLKDSQQMAPVFPGGTDMFLVPEHDVQEAWLLHGHSAAPECGPDGGDLHHSPFTLTIAPPLYSHGEIKHQDFTPVFVPPPILTQEKATGMGGPPPSLVWPCGGRSNSDMLTSRVVLEEAVTERLSRQAELQSRAEGLQRRLQALLGEHAVQHCNQQLEGLTRHWQLGGASSNSLDSIHPGILSPQAGRKGPFTWLVPSTAQFSFTELSEFSHSSQAVLTGLQEELDSEATASSSSDEEEEASHLSGSCERQWLEERAELGSRWSWLQLVLAELDGRIHHLVELHKHIRSSKCGVVLAESQPLTDTQIQQTLLGEMAGLSCTALDTDSEPCSPARLLHNIERQSAQLSQIVNSLMPPLSFSPRSKQPLICKGKKDFISGQREDKVFVPGSTKRGRLRTRRNCKVYLSCVCARTRPLVTYHRPKLFALSALSSSSPQDSTSTLSSSLSSSSCSRCSSCDPVVLCSDPDGSFSRTPSSTPYPALCLSFDAPLSQHLKRDLASEDWSQRPLVNNVQPHSPAHHNRCSSTPLHNSHKVYKQHARHRNGRVMGLSPVAMADSAIKCQHKSSNQRERKRRHIRRLIEDEQDFLYQLCDKEDSSDDVLEQNYTKVPHKQASQGFIRKRQRVSEYNVNNIVIPMSVAKVEKLQYKDILTPSWRVVDTSLMMYNEAEKVDNSEEQEEDLADEVFAKRHLALEHIEKLRWASWGKRQCCRRPKRSGSRLSGSGGGICTSGEESSVELSSAQLDSDEQQSSEECLPQTPWERRMFPLNEDAEEVLLPLKIPSWWSECSSASATSKNSSSHLSPAQAANAALPSGGQSRSGTPDRF